MGAVCSGDTEPSERKFKKSRRGKDVKRKEIGVRGDQGEDGGSSN